MEQRGDGGWGGRGSTLSPRLRVPSCLKVKVCVCVFEFAAAAAAPASTSFLPGWGEMINRVVGCVQPVA